MFLQKIFLANSKLHHTLVYSIRTLISLEISTVKIYKRWEDTPEASDNFSQVMGCYLYLSHFKDSLHLSLSFVARVYKKHEKIYTKSMYREWKSTKWRARSYIKARYIFSYYSLCSSYVYSLLAKVYISIPQKLHHHPFARSLPLQFPVLAFLFLLIFFFSSAPFHLRAESFPALSRCYTNRGIPEIIETS